MVIFHGYVKLPDVSPQFVLWHRHFWRMKVTNRHLRACRWGHERINFDQQRHAVLTDKNGDIDQHRWRYTTNMGYKRTTNGDTKPCELGNIHLQNLACHKKRGLGGSSKETGSPGFQSVFSPPSVGPNPFPKWVIITKNPKQFRMLGIGSIFLPFSPTVQHQFPPTKVALLGWSLGRQISSIKSGVIHEFFYQVMVFFYRTRSVDKKNVKWNGRYNSRQRFRLNVRMCGRWSVWICQNASIYQMECQIVCQNLCHTECQIYSSR